MKVRVFEHRVYFQIAVTGCVHGQLNVLYDELHMIQERDGVKIDAVICTGDFQVCTSEINGDGSDFMKQAVRNKNDLECLACPEKYHRMQDFHEYYNGTRQAPILTVFVGMMVVMMTLTKRWKS